MLIKIAGLVIDVKNRYPYFESFCRGFEGEGKADFTVEVSDEVMEKTLRESPEYPDGYLECLEIYRIICRKILEYDAMLMHCAAICVDDEAYLFTALSGTGKTTHINLWKQKFGDRCFVVNGDKPILRMKNDKFFVCGTPWRGKENYGGNVIVPIKAICVLNRGEKNEIKKIAPMICTKWKKCLPLQTSSLNQCLSIHSIAIWSLRRQMFPMRECKIKF